MGPRHTGEVVAAGTRRVMTATAPTKPVAVDADAPEIERLARDAIAASALYGPANVVMQLARLPIGRGVAESTVDSGRADLHPVKRSRTTASYLIVAMLGSPEERRYMRREVNRSHAAVVRTEEESDVAYSAFDAELQLWVAACIYVGFSVWIEMARGPLSEEQHEAFYRRCMRLGTTLQVSEDAWPPDRRAFRDYWRSGMDELEMDDVTRTYLRNLVNLRRPGSGGGRSGPPGLVARATRPVRRWNRFLAVGFLPPEFREMLGEPWSADDQRRFDGFLRVAIRLDRTLPASLRHGVLNLYERDVKRRIRRGRAIV
jgi:uncharacterized protein (DUF2236 family)